MKKINVRFLANSALLAALYVALTWMLAPISFGPIQFRISEILILLVVYNPMYSIPLTIACLIANTLSGLGWYDLVFGTLATALAFIPMCFIKKPYIAAIFPVISNAFIIALELYLALELPFWYSALTVGAGELIVLYALGVPAMLIITRNDRLVELLSLRVVKKKNKNIEDIDNI